MPPVGGDATGTVIGPLDDRAAVLIAFEQLGGADRALEMARDYALERYAFGRPIGSLQAIKHMLADMYVSATLAIYLDVYNIFSNLLMLLGILGGNRE